MTHAFINDYGEIVWPKDLREDIKIRLRTKGRGSWPIGFYGVWAKTFISWPFSLEQIERILSFSIRHGILIEDNPEYGFSIARPMELMQNFMQIRYEMSYAIQPRHRLGLDFPPHIQAGVEYALHTQRCLIADHSARDRMTIALLAVDQAQAYPCVIACHARDVETWKSTIAELLGKDIVYLDFGQGHPAQREKIFRFLPYEKISEREFDRGLWDNPPKPWSVIADDAYTLKDPNTMRGKYLGHIRSKVPLTYLLGDYVMNLSEMDLVHPLELMQREYVLELSRIRAEELTPDPLWNRRIAGNRRKQTLKELAYFLRATCLLRRMKEARVWSVNTIQIQVEESDYSTLLEDQTAIVRSPLRERGLRKLYSALAWINDFKLRLRGNFLVFAHHNDVVRELSRYTGLPAVYGKVSSDKTRERLIREISGGLIVSNMTEFAWDVRDVTAVVFVEFNTTPKHYDAILEKVLKNNGGQAVDVYFLTLPSREDQSMLARLATRIEDLGIVLGKEEGDE